MASRHPDDILRDVRSSRNFVLVRRRSAGSRKSRVRQCRDRKVRSSRLPSAGDADNWEEKGCPGAEWSTAKGKRQWTPAGYHQDTDYIRNSGFCPTSHHIRQCATTSSGQCSPLCTCSISPPQSSSTQYSRVSSDQQALQVLLPGASEDPVCASAVSVSRHLPVSSNQSLLRTPPLPSQGCASSSLDGRVDIYQDTSATGQCVCLPHREVRPKAADPHSEFLETNRSYVYNHGVESDVTSTSSKSLWVDWQQQSETCSLPNVASSRLCICSQCSAKQVADSEHGYEAGAWVRRSRVFSQPCVFQSPREQFTCVFQRRLHDHHVVRRVSVGAGVPDSQGCQDSTCSRTLCPACPCLRCQQQRHASSSSLARTPLKQQDPILGTPCEEKRCLETNDSTPNTFAYSHSHTSSSCSRKKSYWTRMVRMRYVGRCLLLLVLIGFGGLLAHVTVTDVVSSGHNAGGGVDGPIGGGLVHVDLLMKMQLRPVPLREFQARLRTVRNKFDLLRIFLADRDISDESLMRLLTALISASSHDLVHSDVTNIAMTSPMEDADDATLAAVASNAESHVQIAAGDERTDLNLLEKWGLSPPTTPEVQNVIAKDVSENADTKNLVSKRQKSRRDLPKREVSLPEEQKNSRTGLPLDAVKGRSTLAYINKKASQTTPESVRSVEVSSSTERTAGVESDVREDTSPSSVKNSDVKNNVREETPSFKVPRIKSDVKKDASSPSGLEVSDIKRNSGEEVEVAPLSVNAPGAKNDVREDVLPPSVKVPDVTQLAKVRKRAEPMYDDVDYSADEEIPQEEDYLDEEVGYYNDAAHADALLEELEEAVHHISEMENNPQVQCRDPLPQVVYIEDPKKQNRQFYPECTVIHRCRNDSGCCGRNYECGPKYEQVIFRTFLAVTVNTTSYTVLPDSRMVERIALVNHTECQCREKPRLPDCTQACPGVFQMYRYGAQCVCDCISSANERFPQCDDVKEGLYPLSHDDLVCIKSGRCGPPRCAIGQFDVSSGFCPLKDLYSLPSQLLSDRLRRQYKQRHQRSRQQRRPHRVPVEGSGDF